MASSSTVNSFTQPTTARALRNLYLLRTIVSVLWIATMLTLGRNSEPIGIFLLVIYPLWDAIATWLDLRIQGSGSSRNLQYVNLCISVLTSIALAIAAPFGLYWMIVVFGVWALLAGLIQLYVGLQRRRSLGGQWPMILSGGQSALAGVAFILMASSPTMGLTSLAGYSAFGAFYFLLAALRLRN